MVGNGGLRHRQRRLAGFLAGTARAERFTPEQIAQMARWRGDSPAMGWVSVACWGMEKAISFSSRVFMHPT